ncbi:MAG: PH domain-containing protein [Tannerellaceae bacterium]
MATKQLVFRSRISVLLIILIVGIFMFASFTVFRSRDCVEMGVFVGALAFVMSLLSGIRYTISATTLSLNIWFIRVMRINVADIRSIERSYNPLSSPAASLKRLGVTFTKNDRTSYILISPVDEPRFIAQLKRINPYIDINIPDKKDAWSLLDWDI